MFVRLTLAAIVAALSYVPSTVPVPAADAKKPLLFFFAGSRKIDLGDEYAEIEYGKVIDHVRTRMVADLPKTFGTSVIAQDFHTDRPSGRDIASACAQIGAAGAIEVYDSFGEGAGDTYRGAFTIAVLDCTGSEFFSETGASVHGPGRADIADVVLPAMEDASSRLQKDVSDSPGANANYVRYGIYMADGEADSFWLPTIDGKKTFVETCEPIGTASRAGLRVGDEVDAIDGVPTVGIDFDALNAAMREALAHGSWNVEVVGKDKSKRTIAFENEDVAWYAAHPLGPAEIPTPPPVRAPERRVPLTY